MSLEEIIAKIPLWGIFLASLFLTSLASELGFRAGSWRREKLGEKKQEIRPGPFASAALSLVAFMLALAYGIVQSRLHDVEQVALEEANAVSTVYLRADLLPDADRAQVQEMLREYVTQRLVEVQPEAYQSGEQTVARSQELQEALWSTAVRIAGQIPTDISALFVDSVNELIDQHNMRTAMSFEFRLPAIVWFVLYGLSFLALLMGGFANGYAGCRRSITLAFGIASAFSVMLMLVVWMDRPKMHLSTMTESMMVELDESVGGTARP